MPGPDAHPYTAAERAAVHRHASARVQSIRDALTARDQCKADFRAGLALADAAHYLRRGALAEAHDLMTRAADAWQARHRAPGTLDAP